LNLLELFSSWPGLSRPSTPCDLGDEFYLGCAINKGWRWLGESSMRKHVDGRDKPGHDALRVAADLCSWCAMVTRHYVFHVKQADARDEI